MAEYCAAVPQTSNGELSSLLRRYYKDPGVRKRMCEFLGGADLKHATALYIAGTDGYSDYHVQSPPADLPEYLEGALEVDRSLWDRESLIADIDLEYHNFDYPTAPWQDPERAFRNAAAGTRRNTSKFSRKAGIAPLILVSGRGFHLVWAVSRNAEAFGRLVALGHVPASLNTRYAQPCAPDGTRVDPDLGAAFSGLGLIMEFVGHRVLERVDG